MSHTMNNYYHTSMQPYYYAQIVIITTITITMIVSVLCVL